MRRHGVQKLAVLGIAGLLLMGVLSIAGCDGPGAALAQATALPATLPPTAGTSGIPPASNSAGTASPRPRTLTSGLADSIRFERISVEQGLSQNSVSCILQDHKGFLWLGTADGLNKYNGYDFVVYKNDPENLNSLSDNTVTSMVQDGNGVLWIGTHGGGLNRFDRETERFTHFTSDPNNPHSLAHNVVTSLYLDQEGVLWIGTWGGGLDTLASGDAATSDAKTTQFTHYQNNPTDPYSLSSNYVNTIFQDREGVLWIGTEGGGLDRLNPENRVGPDAVRFAHYQNDPADRFSLRHNTVLAIFQDSEGVLWVGTDGGGLHRLYRETGQFVHYRYDADDPDSLSDNSVSAIFEDDDGVLWIGTDGGGLDRLDREREQFIHHQTDAHDPQSLGSNYVEEIYQDQEGILWIGTLGGGAAKYDRKTERFAHFRSNPNNPYSLNDNIIRAIYQDQAGVFWIGTDGGGLLKFDREKQRFTQYKHDPADPYSLVDNRVWSLCEDQSGGLWIGTGEGLDKFNRKTGQFFHYRGSSASSESTNPNLSDTDVLVVYLDAADTLWIGTGGKGLFSYSRETSSGAPVARLANYQSDPQDPDNLSSNTIWSIFQDSEGVLWIGTDGGGLNKFDSESERFAHYLNDSDDPDSLSDNSVSAIFQDHEGVLWIGTAGGGLNKFDRETETFANYRESDGLPNDMVHGILEDNQGYLWLSTNKGLARFDPRTETFKRYDVSDGLQSNEFNVGAYCHSDSGEMFFGGINGFNAFFPDQIVENQHRPPVVLTALTQSGESVNEGTAVENVNKVSLHWPNNFFEFEFAALSYTQPEKNQYAYMLEGFDKEWNYLDTKRFGRYTNLPAGSYTLRIKGTNNDGVWNEEGTSVAVTIVPPFWATLWFRALTVLVVAAGLIGGYRLRVKSVEARSRELATLVDERTRALEQRTYELQERTHELEQRTRETERRRQELEALYHADTELHRYLRLDEVLQALVDIAVDMLEADKSSVLALQQGQKGLVLRVARGFSPETMAQLSAGWGEGITGQVASSGEPMIVEDALRNPYQQKERDEMMQAVLAEGIRSFMHLPIIVNDEVFAVFNVNYTEPHAFGEDEIRLFLALAQRAALAIENAQLYEQTQELVVMEERNRLARDLHDAVTQTLFSASLIAEALPKLWANDQQEGQELLQELRQLSRGALAEMRTLLLELRPAGLVETSLGELLRQLGEAVTGRKGVPVKVTVDGHCAPPADVHVALYRIAQEALNNVVKHAQAGQVEVSLRCGFLESEELSSEQKTIELCICDNGRGFDPNCVPSECLGLNIIRERTQAIGAALDITTQPGHGTRVVVSWKG